MTTLQLIVALATILSLAGLGLAAWLLSSWLD